MRVLPTLRQEFLSASVLVFAGALIVAALGILLMLPRLETPGFVALYLSLLLSADVAVFVGGGANRGAPGYHYYPTEVGCDKRSLISGGRWWEEFREAMAYLQRNASRHLASGSR